MTRANRILHSAEAQFAAVQQSYEAAPHFQQPLTAGDVLPTEDP